VKFNCGTDYLKPQFVLYLTENTLHRNDKNQIVSVL